MALKLLTASYFRCNLRTTLVIVAWDTLYFCDCQYWQCPAARVVKTSFSSGVRHASRSNSSMTTRFNPGLSTYRLVLLGKDVALRLLAVSDTGGGGIIDHTQDHQHTKHGVDHGNQPIADVANIQGVAENGGHGLNQKQHGGNHRKPKVLVFESYSPVNHFVFLLKFLAQPKPGKNKPHDSGHNNVYDPFYHRLPPLAGFGFQLLHVCTKAVNLLPGGFHTFGHYRNRRCQRVHRFRVPFQRVQTVGV
nr:MAG TPA: hypothetical protein [Caudoviricetes sp.]